jgi:multidrug resistance efflux pump
MGVAEELERLQALRDRGAISDEEFTRAKALFFTSACALSH